LTSPGRLSRCKADIAWWSGQREVCEVHIIISGKAVSALFAHARIEASWALCFALVQPSTALDSTRARLWHLRRPVHTQIPSHSVPRLTYGYWTRCQGKACTTKHALAPDKSGGHTDIESNSAAYLGTYLASKTWTSRLQSYENPARTP
jgi:hypothetical protein